VVRRDRDEPLDRLAVPQEDPGRRLGAVDVPEPVDDGPLAEQLGVRAELPLQVALQLDVVAEVPLRPHPRDLLPVEHDRLVEERVRRLLVLSAEVLLRPVPDAVLLEPRVEATLPDDAAGALELHPGG